jgi:molecular chaperone IbpA
MLAYDFSPLFRSSIGFDSLTRLIDGALQSEQSDSSYPPYDIVQPGENAYRIVLAVAGFAREDLSIETKPNELTITGRSKPENADAARYLHRGLAASAFTRRFQLADHVRVTDARLADGLLTIDLVRDVPEALRPRRIEIAKSGGGQRSALDGRNGKVIEGKAEAVA